MAEALAVVGVVSNIVALVDFSMRLYGRLKEIIADVGDVPKSFRPIKTELPVLMKTLEDIGKAFKESKLSEETAKVIAPAVEGCKTSIQELEKLLAEVLLDPKDRRSKKLWKTFKSIVKEGEVNGIIVAIRGYVGTLTFCLAALATSSQPPTEDKLICIRRWLLAPDPTVNYKKALLERQANTGQWLLDSSLYQDWKDVGAVLWLHGIPGCGKTILSTTIIENIQEYSAKDPGKALAYFYFDFKDQQKQGPDSMVRSLIIQLSQQFGSIPVDLERLYESCDNGKNQPYWNALLATLQPVIRAVPHTFIIIDTLDECTQREDLMEVIKEILRWQIGGLHVLVTSRREGDIENGLAEIHEKRSIVSIQTEAVTHDMQLYIHERLSHDDRLRKWQTDATMLQQIEASLLRNARGMFRWAVCQLDFLGECRNRRQLLQALDSLPPTLDATYDRIFSKIRESDQPYALRILRWLTFATRPLNLLEVAEIAAMDPDRASIFDREEILENPKDVLSICSSLIVVTEEPQDQYNSPSRQNSQHTEIVQLAHYSVKEYLVSQRIHNGPAAPYGLQIMLCNTQIAKCCLQYLLQFEAFDKLHERSLQEFTLKSYSAKNWAIHVREGSQHDKDIQNLCFELLSTCKKASALWYRLHNSRQIFVDSVLDIPKFNAPRLYFASQLGLTDVVERMLDIGEDPNGDGHADGITPLQAAACNGHISTVQVLIERGADVHLVGKNHMNALSATLSRGQIDVARLLIDHGAEINARCPNYGCAIHAIHAAIRGGIDAVQLLLERHCDLYAISSSFCQPMSSNHRGRTMIYAGNALQACTRYGDPEIAKLLVAHGTQINGLQGHYKTILHAASECGNLAMVKFLLAHGADVHEQNKKCNTAIHQALNRSHIDIAIHLIEYVALPTDNSPYCNFDRALYNAILHRNIDTTTFMLKHGADANAICLDYSSPLESAFRSCDSVTVRLLLAHGADPNTMSIYTEDSPFLQAIQQGDLDLAKCFIDYGADANGRDRLKGAPLVLASQGHIDIVQLLLEHGANTWCHEELGSALAMACGGGKLETVKLLIANGAPINQRDYETIHPLQSASKCGHLDVARYLLERGADVTAKIAGLHEAISVGNMEMTSLILQHLASHGGRDAYFGEALSRAVRAEPLIPTAIESKKDRYTASGSVTKDCCAVWTWTKPTDMVRFLIEQGANVNARDDRNSTALLQAVLRAALRDDYGVVELLIEQGADVNARDDEIGTVLEAALIPADLDLARKLIEKGANVNTPSLTSSYWRRNWWPKQGSDVQKREIVCGGTLLELASLEGNLDIVKLLIEKGAQVQDNYGRFGSALIAASCSSHDNPEVTDILLQNGANVNTHHNLYGTALSAASRRGHVQIVTLLLERGASIDNKVEAHDGVLLAALQGSFERARHASNEDSRSIESSVERKSTSIIELLVQSGAEFDTDCDVVGLLLEAAISNNLDVMEMLIEGLDNSRGFNSEIFNVILWIASCRGQEDVIHALFSMERCLDSRCRQVGQVQGHSLALKSALDQGHLDIAAFLIREGGNVELSHSQWKTYLSAASSDGHLEVVKFIVEKLIHLEAPDDPYGDALAAASASGQYTIVNFLIENGADVNAPSKQYGTALLAASSEGRHNIVRLLISKGANMNATSKEFGSAFYVAVCRKDHNLMNLLIRRGVDINIQGGEYGNALQAALAHRHYRIARHLIRKGADMNAQGGRYGNALQATLSVSRHRSNDAKERHDMAIYLIENGANINVRGGQYGSALLAALSNSHHHIAEVLFRKGADINTRAGIIDMVRLVKILDGGGGFSYFEKFPIQKIAHLASSNNAAIAALMGGFPDTARRLVLEQETSFVVSTTEYRNILSLAVVRGNVALVTTLLDRAENGVLSRSVITDLLLKAIAWRRDTLAQAFIDRGADIDARDKDDHSALQLAVLSLNVFMVKVLIEKNANINACSPQHGTVLQTAILIPSMGYGFESQHAALIFSMRLTHYLLMRGADLNIQGGPYGNALQAAIQTRFTRDEYGYEDGERVIYDIVHTLIEKGADINADGGEYGNALQAALHLGKLTIAELLIRKGANVHMRGEKHGNLIQAALSGGCRDLAEVLISQGVDFDTNKELEVALRTALSKGYDGIVDLLLGKHNYPDLTDEEWDEALQKAVLKGDIDSVRAWARFTRRCSELSGRQRALNDAVAVALARGHHDIFEYLVEEGAKIDLEAFRRCAEV